MREDFNFVAFYFCFIAGPGHVASGALVFNHCLRLWVVDIFAANTGLPVRIARGIGHDAGTPVEADGNIFARGSGKVVVTRQAAVGSLKFWLQLILRGWLFSCLFITLTNKSRR